MAIVPERPTVTAQWEIHKLRYQTEKFPQLEDVLSVVPNMAQHNDMRKKAPDTSRKSALVNPRITISLMNFLIK